MSRANVRENFVVFLIRVPNGIIIGIKENIKL